MRHQRKCCWVLGSGPRTLPEDLSFLNAPDVFTFAVNRTAIVAPWATWIVVGDHRLYGGEEKFVEFNATFKGLESKMIVMENGPEWRAFKQPFRYVGQCPNGRCNNITIAKSFADLKKKGAYMNGTSSLFAIQVAISMGFNCIHLLGVDLDWDGERTHFFGKDEWNVRKDFQDPVEKKGGLFAMMETSFANASHWFRDAGIDIVAPAPRLQKYFPPLTAHATEILNLVFTNLEKQNAS